MLLQEFEASLAELKPKVTKALELGKQLKERCSSIDKSHISDQLDQLNNAWSQLNTDSLARKHSLEDGLLQLGQFQDALGRLLAWILDSTGKLSNVPPPGIKVGTVETQLRDLQVIPVYRLLDNFDVCCLISIGHRVWYQFSCSWCGLSEQCWGEVGSSFQYLRS